jgi:hypothetical protein
MDLTARATSAADKAGAGLSPFQIWNNGQKFFCRNTFPDRQDYLQNHG